MDRKKDNPQKSGGSGFSSILFILLAGSCWGSIGIFVRTFDRAGLRSMDIVAMRAVFTALFMFLFLFVTDREKLRIRLRDIWCFIGTGIVSMVFFNICYFRLITVASLSVAAVMLYTAPVFVMLLSALLFRERITVQRLIALVMTVAGCLFVTGLVGNTVPLTPLAILLGLGAGLGYALYSIFSRFALRKGYHSFTISFYTFLIAGAAILPFCHRAALLDYCFRGPGEFAFSALCGLVTTVLPYIVYNFGLAGVETGQAAIIASIEPVVATVIGVLLFHETMTGGNLLGIALVLGAIVLANWKSAPSEKTDTAIPADEPCEITGNRN